ncbi:MAG: M14 family metallocarboxypeptidase [Defluviitaleaceae bacterium]|nr:M14 family metallocarboxypeptidase [Defluviitaleaceae bacterium]
MFTSKIFENRVEEILHAHPFIHREIIGTSRCGVAIQSLVIGSGEKSVLINAAHHANEWITSLILLRFIEEYAKKIPENITLHCIPLVNPDGVDLLDPTWKANICGVDLNSNYPAGWEIARERKFANGFSAPGARDFVGEKPLCEPESCAMAAYTIFHEPHITLSLHTQGEEIYWRYMDFNPPGAEELARRFAKVSGYKNVDVPDENSHAGYRDWFIARFNRPGFTIECGLGENPLPLSQFDDMYEKVKKILWEAMV